MSIYVKPTTVAPTPVYSNIDHELNVEVATLLEANPGKVLARHAAWDFNGSVWLDPESGLWIEEVWRYGVLVETISGESLVDVVDEANGKYGAR